MAHPQDQHYSRANSHDNCAAMRTLVQRLVRLLDAMPTGLNPGIRVCLHA